MGGGEREGEVGLGFPLGCGQAIGEGGSAARGEAVLEYNGVYACLRSLEVETRVRLALGSVVVGGQLFALGVVNFQNGVEWTAQSGCCKVELNGLVFIELDSPLVDLAGFDDASIQNGWRGNGRLGGFAVLGMVGDCKGGLAVSLYRVGLSVARSIFQSDGG